VAATSPAAATIVNATRTSRPPRENADRHQRCRVDQAEHEEREAERSDAGAAVRAASNDRDPDDIVESTG